MSHIIEIELHDPRIEMPPDDGDELLVVYIDNDGEKCWMKARMYQTGPISHEFWGSDAWPQIPASNVIAWGRVNIQ